MTPATPEDNDDMPAEFDFSNAERGKFYRPGAVFHLPAHADDTEEQAAD